MSFLLALATLSWSTHAPFQAAGTPPPASRALFEPELRILHEFQGEGPGDQFGWIGRNAGDCDGDGIADVLLSAPTRATDGPSGGRIYVYSGKTGARLFTHDGQVGDTLGWSLSTAGDVNGDGRADVIAGAPGAAGNRGAALVLSGADGGLLLRLEGETAGDFFGRSVGAAGDVNHDGHADLLAGADGCNSIGPGAGRAYVYSGKDGALLLSLDGDAAGDKFGVGLCAARSGDVTLLAVGAAGAGARGTGRLYLFELHDLAVDLRFTLEGDATATAFGRSFLSFPGDLDGDACLDVYVSDFQNAASGKNTGRITVFSGRDGKPLVTLTGENAGDGFGIGTADVGDVDGDGRADLLIGAWQNAEGAPSGGKCYLYSGRDGALRASWVCTVANETFGFDTTGMGDVNGDGVPDYLITNAWSGVRGAKAGRAFVLAGERP